MSLHQPPAVPDTPDLTRYAQFLKTPSEDWQARADMGITDSELEVLHKLMVEDPASWRNLYYCINIARLADNLYALKFNGITIAQLRQKLSRVDQRHYRKGTEEIQETRSFRFWPVFEHICRERTSLPNPTTVIIELELRLLTPEPNFNAYWMTVRSGLIDEVIELAQWIMREDLSEDTHERLWRIVYLPPANTFCRVILSQEYKRESHTFPLKPQYFNHLRKAAEGKRFEADKHPIPKMPHKMHSSEELAAAEHGFLEAILKYDSGKGPSDTYLMHQIRWRLGDEFDKRSSNGLLHSRIESSGGSLDAPAFNPYTGESDLLMHDTVADPRPGIDQILEDADVKKNALAMLKQELESDFYQMLLAGTPMKEIAAALGKSDGTTYKRFERALKAVRLRLGFKQPKKRKRP